MSQKSRNQPEYGTELKLAAVRRVLAGESVRKRLYVWKDRYAELGEAGLVHRRGGRPRKVVSEDKHGPDAISGRGELLAARKRIAELERKVGQQELELDFFGEALRRIKAGAKRSAR
ncbi:MAG: helix-turn-helix domain-containing protein [Terriglobales bacterium]